MIKKQILNYKIISEIGSGGMATVYKAKHIRFDRYVAIKILDKALTSKPEIKKRFIQEAEIMENLSHPGIVKVIDLHEDGDELAIVMELLEGNTLKEYSLKRKKLKNKQIKDIFLQVLEALDYGHNQGVVHRDIKPSNIFITKESKAKLLDFGIAKIIGDQASHITRTGLQMGTPVFMSPEQVNDGKHLDKRTDIYSLGVTLWYVLAGKAPYDENSESLFAIYKRIDSEPLPELGLPFFDKIIQKATQKDKNNRFQSCKEFAEALRNPKDDDKTILETPPPEPPKPELEPEPQPDPEPPQPPPSGNNNNSTPYIIGGVVLLLLIGLFVWRPWDNENHNIENT